MENPVIHDCAKQKGEGGISIYKNINVFIAINL
jgi:hypothetical protein